jgi:hypothetical protein
MITDYELEQAVLKLSSHKYREHSEWKIIQVTKYDNGEMESQEATVHAYQVQLSAFEAVAIARALGGDN